ncbi:thioesterase [Candidatus Bathyarchaeota archaeon]|nr:thioesterase [Candidatus Bathyarchaeota archaeon]
MFEQKTHLKISNFLVGTPIEIIEDKSAIVELETSEVMLADNYGLIHGGFTIGLADYAAMLAVNDPFVVLAAVDLKLVAPVKIGDKMIAYANIIKSEGKKREVSVNVLVKDKIVLTGLMTCYKLDKHVLDNTK